MKTVSNRGRQQRWIATLGAAILSWSAGVLPAIADEEIIHACVKELDGRPRIVGDPSQCRGAESELSWNMMGPPGRDGAGIQGIRQVQGPTVVAPPRTNIAEPNYWSSYAECDEGEVLLSGGFFISGEPHEDARIVDSLAKNGKWQATISNLSFTETATVIAFATCAVIAP